MHISKIPEKTALLRMFQQVIFKATKLCLLGSIAIILGCHSKENLELSKACFEGNMQNARLALGKGADPNARISSSKMTPLMIAGCGIEAVQALDSKTDTSKLLTGIRSDPTGRVEIIRLLLSLGADAKATNSGGYGTLFYAITGDLPLGCRLLIEAGANPTLVERSGFSPLHFACITGKAECLELLVQGLPPKAVDVWCAPIKDGSSGLTPLMQAADHGYVKCVDVLLKAGATVNLSDDKIGTALTFASMRGHLEVVQLLLKAGADLEEPAINGSTPLKKSSYGGHEELVTFLISIGANVNAKDKHGRTPLMEASFKGHINIVKLLLTAKAIVDIADNKGQTAMSLAKSSGQSEIAQLIQNWR